MFENGFLFTSKATKPFSVEANLKLTKFAKTCGVVKVKPQGHNTQYA